MDVVIDLMPSCIYVIHVVVKCLNGWERCLVKNLEMRSRRGRGEEIHHDVMFWPIVNNVVKFDERGVVIQQ